MIWYSFKIVVNAVVNPAMMEVSGPQEAHHGLVLLAVYHNIVLYADNSRIEGCNPNLVQTMTVVVRMFKIVGLQTNLVNTKAAVCTVGFILGKQVKLVYKRGAMGSGFVFIEQKRTIVSCK